jgi:hypothetical protein
MPTALHHLSRTLSLSLVLASGALALAAVPARAHSQAACKIEALYACQDMQGVHGICVQYAIQLCAGHSHAINNLPYRSGAPGTGPVRRHGLVGPGVQPLARGAFAPHRSGPANLRMGSVGRFGR